jgi:beta-phosphoglucomutase-like phosphatase (HAD superfamily)
MMESLPIEPQALIFDCDGTLADTMPIHYVAWRNAMQKHGIEFSEDRFYELGGVPTLQIIELLSQEQGVDVDLQLAAEDKEQGFLQKIAQVHPVEPIVAIAREHHGRLPMGVGSGSASAILKQTLTHLGILDLFDCFVGSEDTQRHKPEPDVFLEVARLLNVAPQSCRVYEDTDIGIEAARRAGMQWFDVRTVHTPRRIT